MTDPEIKEIRDHVQRIDDALRGNGSSGLFTEFAVMRERVSAIERFIFQLEGLRRWFLMGIACLFGTMFWQILEWFLSKPF
jgi:hypothetical protein